MIINASNISLLYQGFSTAFNQGAMSAPSRWKDIAMRVPSTTKSETYGWLASVPHMREWVGSRVIQNLSVRGYTITNRLFESTVSVARTEIEDDQYGIYAPVMEQMGAEAALHPDRLVFGLLAAGFSSYCFDGQYFFDLDHPVGDGGVLQSVSNVQTGSGPAWYLLDCSKVLKPVIFQDRMPFKLTALHNDTDEVVFQRDEYVYGVRSRCNVGFGLWQLAFGSKADLNSANYAAARNAMQMFTADNGRPLGINPTHLVVPPALEVQARTLLKAQTNAAGASNIWCDSAELLQTPYLFAGI